MAMSTETLPVGTESGLLGWPTPGPIVRAADAASQTVYAALAAHQQKEHWFGSDFLVCLHDWADRLNLEFKLKVPDIALRVDALSRRCYGHFRYGHNGFGLRGEIAINARYLTPDRKGWQVLGTLAHEMLHGWQQQHGKPGKGNYHNLEFREKALQYGLVIDERGVTEYLSDSPFMRLLARHGVDVPPLDLTATPAAPRDPGQSKMKKWSCGCTNVRCAVELHARCMDCGHVFERAM